MKFLLTLLTIPGIASAQVVTTSQYGVNFTGTVTLGTDQPVTFYECTFTGSNVQALMSVGMYDNVTCIRCTFRGTNPTVYGCPLPVGIWATGAYKLYLYGCHFSDLRDCVFEDGQWTVGTDTMFWGCTFEHVNNRESDGHGSWLDTIAWPGAAVCFFRVKGYQYGDHKFSVTYCTFLNIPGVDEGGDLLNVYESTNLDCENNSFHGGRGLIGPNLNGNAIVTDDEWADAWKTRGKIPGDFDWTTSGCVFKNNRIEDGCIGVWAGHDNQFINNRVINFGLTATGQSFQMFGIQRCAPEGPDWASSNVVSGNQVETSYGAVWALDNQGNLPNWTGNTNF